MEEQRNFIETPTITDTPTQTLTPTPSFTVVPTQTPTATTVPQNGHVVYIYDGDGNLVKSIIGDVVTYYPNGAYELKVSGSNEVITKHYSAGSSRIAYRINGEIIWLLSDHLGSTVGTVDADEELIGTLKYTAYGELRTGSSTTDYRYTGQRVESEIGLYYYVARFYDPAVGRFVSPDTIISETGNTISFDRYAYANGNSIKYNDPSGHCPLCVSALIGAGVGAVVGAAGYGIYTAISGKEFNWKHFALATGGGAVAGALIGTGVGIASGISSASATSAAITAGGITEGANVLCAGDMCASETDGASRVVNGLLSSSTNSLPKVETTIEQVINVTDKA